MPRYVEDLYEEFKFTEHFGNSVPFEDMSAHKTDWWLRFMKLDEEVAEELRPKPPSK